MVMHLLRCLWFLQLFLISTSYTWRDQYLRQHAIQKPDNTIPRSTSPSIACSNTFTFFPPTYGFTNKTRLDFSTLSPVAEGDTNTDMQFITPEPLNFKCTQATITNIVCIATYCLNCVLFNFLLCVQITLLVIR